MEFRYTQKFKKQFKKLPQNVQDNFAERVDLLVSDPTNPKLRLHPLKGKFVGYWSMNVTGDVRALYREDGERIIIFFFFFKHS